MCNTSCRNGKVGSINIFGCFSCLFLEMRHIIIVCSICKDRVSMQCTEVRSIGVSSSNIWRPGFPEVSQLAQLPVVYSHLEKLKWSITPHYGALSSFYVPYCWVLRNTCSWVFYAEIIEAVQAVGLCCGGTDAAMMIPAIFSHQYSFVLRCSA